MAWYYNDMLLPELPTHGNCKYWFPFWFQSTQRNYVMIGSSEPFYRVSGDSYKLSADGEYCRYNVNAAQDGYTLQNEGNATTSHSWSFPNITWSNYDIPNGSADSTDIYFYGSEPVDPNAPEQPTEEVYYKISGTRLTEFANAIRGKTGKEDSLTLEQMVTEIEGIEAGGIPENARLYYVGNAVSEFSMSSLSFTSSAVGALSE